MYRFGTCFLIYHYTCQKAKCQVKAAWRGAALCSPPAPSTLAARAVPSHALAAPCPRRAPPPHPYHSPASPRVPVAHPAALTHLPAVPIALAVHRRAPAARLARQHHPTRLSRIPRSQSCRPSPRPCRPPRSAPTDVLIFQAARTRPRRLLGEILKPRAFSFFAKYFKLCGQLAELK